MKLYQQIATSLQAMLNCVDSGNQEWLVRHRENIDQIVRDLMPSGSGVDTGTAMWIEESTPNKLVFHFSFHHMDDMGGYDGWTEHTLTVKPDLAFGFALSISGPDRNDIKDYLHELFHYALSQELAWSNDRYQRAA